MYKMFYLGSVKKQKKLQLNVKCLFLCLDKQCIHSGLVVGGGGPPRAPLTDKDLSGPPIVK